VDTEQKKGVAPLAEKIFALLPGWGKRTVTAGGTKEFLITLLKNKSCKSWLQRWEKKVAGIRRLKLNRRRTKSGGVKTGEI